MARARPIITHFNGGAISRKLDGRPDLAWYHHSCRFMRNAWAWPHGPTEGRGGLAYVSEIKASANRTHLIEYEFDKTQAYMIEAGDRYFRFFRDHGQIVVPATDAAIANGDFTAGIASWDEKSTGGGANAISHDAVGLRLTLTPDGTAADDIGWAEQAVTVGAGFKDNEHGLRFRCDGRPGDELEIRIGTTTTGAEILDTVRTPGEHLIAFTPGVTTFYVQFRAAGARQEKVLHIDDVDLLNDTPIELRTPYLQADLFDEAGRFRIKFHSTEDVLYLVVPGYPARRLERRGNTTWSLSPVNFIDGPYLDENTTVTTLTPSAATGNGIMLTASAVTGINDGQGFLDSDVGRLVSVKIGGDWGYAIITARTSELIVVADVLVDFGGTTASAAWRLGLWSDTTGYPAAVTLHEQRLGLGGGTTVNPARIDLSKSTFFETFTPGANDADPVPYTIAAKSASVFWLASGAKHLLAGTLGGVHRFKGKGIDEPITPATPDRKPASEAGCADLRPATINPAALFVDRFGRALHELAFSFEVDGYKDPDISQRAEHLLLGGITSIAYQGRPARINWATRTDGRLLGLTYQRDEGITGWHEHPVADLTQVGAVVEAVGVIPCAVCDELWAIVRLTIGGATKRYVCYLKDGLAEDAPVEDSFFVDFGVTLDNTGKFASGTDACTLTPGATTGDGVTFLAGAAVFTAGDVDQFIKRRYIDPADAEDENGFVKYKTAVAKITGFTSGTDVTADILVDFPSTAVIAATDWRLTVSTVSGADHLEGETAQICGDGAAQAAKLVTGGSATLDQPAATVHLGLGYRTKIVPTRRELGGEGVTTMGAKQRVASLIVRFFRSAGCKYGPAENDLQTLTTRPEGLPGDTAIPLFTGDKHVNYDGDFDRKGDLTIVQDEPLPCTITSLIPSTEAHPT